MLDAYAGFLDRLQRGQAFSLTPLLYDLNMLYYRFLFTTQTWGFPIPPLLGRLGHTPGSGLPADTKRTHFRPHQVHMYSIRLLSAISAS